MAALETTVEKPSIAIIGMSCQFPGAIDVSSYWRLIKANRCVIGAPPAGRVCLRSQAQALGIPVNGGYLEDCNAFDASRFHISEREAALMDPQQKLVLTHVCNAIEDAGFNVSELKGNRTGVFVGAMANDLAYLKFSDIEHCDVLTILGNGLCLIANRVSYELDFGGPSITTDSACSSSLVALHQAIASLNNDECDYALVAGVNIILSGLLQKFYTDAGVGSADGRCQSFSSTAAGIGRAEGVGVILLRRGSADVDGALTTARPERYAAPRQFYAMVNGSSVNNGGQSSRFTAPNKSAQIDLLKNTYLKAGVGATQVTYVEGHGTGTKQGDYIEINALKEVFGACVSPCLLGSVKSLIGHTEAASGMAGLIKIALMLHHRYIPPSLYFNSPSDRLGADSPVQLVGQGHSMDGSEGKKYYMGVSAFGLGGTNAHAVLSNVTSMLPCPR